MKHITESLGELLDLIEERGQGPLIDKPWPPPPRPMPPPTSYYQTEHWRRVREETLARDGHRCQWCPSTIDLVVHHESYAHVGAELPEDVVTLCARCHGRHHAMNPAP